MQATKGYFFVKRRVESTKMFRKLLVSIDEIISPGDKFFWFNLKYLSYTGLFVNDDWSINKKKMYKLYQYSLDFLGVCYIIGAGIGCREIKNDYAVLIENLIKTLVGYNYLFKSLAFVQNHDKFKVLIEDIKTSGDVISEKHNKFMKIFAVAATILPLALLSSFSLKATMKYELPLVIWSPLDIYKSIYHFVFVLQVVALMFVSLQCRAVAMQGMVCSLIVYICDQFLELQQRMTNLEYNMDNEINFKNEFKSIIKKHIRLIRYGNLISKIFNMFFLIQNLAVIVEMCLNALMITSIGFGQKNIVNFLAFLFIALINAYIYCYLGQKLITKSKEIGETAYDLNWTSWPVNQQKDLLLLIRVSQRPLCLTAGGLAPMSIETFAQILYNGYSIFAVLEDVVK